MGVPVRARSTLGLLEGLPVTEGERYAALQRAVVLIAQPYVWAGEWEKPDAPDGEHQAHGGFDCAGLVMRVFVHDPAVAPGGYLRVGGRSTYEIAKSTPKPKRLAAEAA